MTGGVQGVSGVPCRPVDPTVADELPGAARQLVKAATGAGWSAVATFAAAALPGDDEVTHSTVVRLAHDAGHRAVAVWTGGRPDFGWYRPAGWPWWTRCGVRDVAALVRATTPRRRKRGAPEPADPFALEAELEVGA